MSNTPAPPKKLSRQQRRNRRALLRSVGVGIGVVGAALLGFFPVIKGWAARLRPPGAIAEEPFLAACIKCGQCVQVCPVEAISGFKNRLPTPFFQANRIAKSH